MKTTFKTVFCELDDELVNIDIPANGAEDIDVEKIKGEVMMRINSAENNDSKKKIGKRIFVILAAAVLVIGLTVTAFATGSIQSIFKGYFKGEQMNDLGLYDGGNVEVHSDEYDVKLLGVISDGEIAYSAIEVTKKDGSPIAEDGFYINSSQDTFVRNSYEFSFGGEQLAGGAISRGRCALSEDRKTLSIYTDYARGVGMDRAMEDFRVTYHSSVLNGYRLDKILYTQDLPEKQSNDGWTDEDGYNEEMLLRSLREENGLTQEECIWVRHDGKQVYAKGEEKQFELTFDVSFDIRSTVDNQIECHIDFDKAPAVVKDYTSSAKVMISPLGISLSGECDQKYDK